MSLETNQRPVSPCATDKRALACSNKIAGRSQNGQVIPLTLVFLTALILSLWVLYDAGQVNIEKMKLQNNADASAYSTATIVARDLNFIAYTNRGMVANQVAIGQTIGLVSWVHHMDQFAENLDTLGDILQIVPYVGEIINAITSALESMMDAAQSTIESFAKIMVPINDTVIEAISAGQATYHYASLLAAAEVLSDVTAANDPKARQVAAVGGVSMVSVATMIQQLNSMIGTQQIARPSAYSYSSSNDYQKKRFEEFQSIVIASEDPFTFRRSYDYIPRTGFGLEIWLPKYGGSEFKASTGSDGKYKYQWTAMDDASLWTFIDLGIFGTIKTEAPVGWGAAHALNSGSGSWYSYSSNRNKSLYGKGAWKNRNAAYLASSYDGSDNISGVRNGGLRRFFDFKEDGTGYDAGPAVTILLSKNDTDLQTQRAMDQNNANFHVNATNNSDVYVEQYGGPASDQITALSKAEPYFYRPVEKNGSIDTWIRAHMSGLDSKLGPANIPNGSSSQFEHGNLYGPFWQARLTDTSDAERLAAIGLSTAL